MRYILLRMKRFCGFITGFVFFLSGIVKLMDPVGAGLVMNEYFNFLHMGFLSFSAKGAGVFFALAETLIGTALITGVWRRPTVLCAIGLQTFFTLLTLLLVIFNPEMDCGCFGEAIHLTHMQTFLKNILIFGLLLIYYIPGRHLGEARKKKYISFSLVTASVIAFTVYSLIYIPLIDFTAYRPGAELEAGAEINADAMYESVFTYEKDGIRETFTLGHLPDSTWTFVNTETRLKKGYEESLTGLSFYDPATGDYRDNLATEGKVMAISVYDSHMGARKWSRTEAFISRASKAGFTVLLLCASEEEIPISLADSAYISDYKTLISLNRSNGGVTYFHNGQLIRKWACINTPDATELKEIAETAATEIVIAQDSKGSLVFQGFLLYVTAIMLLL